MTFTTTADAAAALDAIRSQRAAASATLDHLELYRQLEPRAECRAEWTDAASVAYETDLNALLMRLAGVRAALRDGIDDLWVVIGEAGLD